MISCAGLIVREDSERASLCAEKAKAFFHAKGIRTVDPLCTQGEPDPDIILTFGGDGTLLSGKEASVRYGAPLFGVNLGNMGFLTEGDPDRLDSILPALTEGCFETEKRSLLRVRVPGQEDNWLAMNDAVLTRGGFARLIQVNTFVNGEHFATFTADGVIVATPTGSTGYSLSAGGPVVAPDVRCMILTPVCAHSLQHCPCIVPDNAEIRIRLAEKRNQSAELQIDGKGVLTLPTGTEITVTGAEEQISLIRLKPYEFFTLTRDKLIEWGS